MRLGFLSPTSEKTRENPRGVKGVCQRETESRPETPCEAERKKKNPRERDLNRERYLNKGRELRQKREQKSVDGNYIKWR